MFFADVMHIAFHRCHEHFAFGFACNFFFSIYGLSHATACFITRADFTTCGGTFCLPQNKSPTTFIPSIKGPSMTSKGRGILASLLRCLHWYRWLSLWPTHVQCVFYRQFTPWQIDGAVFFLPLKMVSATCIKWSVASWPDSPYMVQNHVFNGVSASGPISSYSSSMAGLTIPMVMPFW